MDLSNLKAHPFAELFPLMEGEQFANLVASIRADGLVQPIVLFQGMTLDGRNRVRACTEAGVELVPGVHTRTFNGTEAEALDYVTATNLTRRHLTSSQRALVAATMASLRRGGSSAGERDGVISTAAAAEALSVSPFLVKQARRVRRGAAAHVIAMVERGDITLSAAEAVGQLSARRQASLKTAEAVKAAAERQRRATGPFAGYSAERLLASIVEATAESFARPSLREFVDAGTAEMVAKLDEAVDRLRRLRDAMAEAHGTAARATA